MLLFVVIVSNIATPSNPEEPRANPKQPQAKPELGLLKVNSGLTLGSTPSKPEQPRGLLSPQITGCASLKFA